MNFNTGPLLLNPCSCPKTKSVEIIDGKTYELIAKYQYCLVCGKQYPLMHMPEPRVYYSVRSDEFTTFDFSKYATYNKHPVNPLDQINKTTADYLARLYMRNNKK